MAVKIGSRYDLDDLLTWPILSGLGMDILTTITKAHVYNNGDRAIVVNREDVIYNVFRNKTTGKMEMEQNIVLTGQKIKSFSCSDHCFALSDGGVLYGWGSNSNGQLGNTDVNEIPLEAPIVVKELEDHKITQAACGGNFTLTLTEDGEVWIWGWNNNSQCTGTAVSAFTPLKALNLPKCSQIGVNRYTAAALTTDGSLYTWGCTSYGQLGNKSTTNVSAPNKVKMPRRLVEVSLGFDHLLALTDGGRILGLGFNGNGQIGHNQKGTNVMSPVVLECYENDVAVKFFDVAALGDTSAALSTDGVVYIWGQCGTEGKKFDQPILMKTGLRNLNEALARHSGIGTYQTLVILNDDIARDLMLAFDNELLSDCRIVLEGKTIYAQKAVLKNRSPYFQAMFNAEWKEADGEIKINNHAYTGYKALLKYLYTGQLDIQDEELIPFLQLAHETMHEKLVSLCAEKLSYKISVENVLENRDVARELDAEPLLTCCRRFRGMCMDDSVKAEN